MHLRMVFVFQDDASTTDAVNQTWVSFLCVSAETQSEIESEKKNEFGPEEKTLLVVQQEVASHAADDKLTW